MVRKKNHVEVRGRYVYFNGREIGEVFRGNFNPNARGTKLGLCWAQVNIRGALDYVTDVLRRSGEMSHTEWRVSRRAAANRRVP